VGTELSEAEPAAIAQDGDDGDDSEFSADIEAMICREEPERTDGPDYLFEPEEKSTRDPNYLFCPAQHRDQLLRLFAKHLVRHPFFPEKDGQHATAAKIRHDSVHEMYVFCKQRDLREVWGYMWACWYSPQRWPLWARSSDGERLSRLRTTMTVENHWKQVKHIHLHNLVHPRLDQLVYILIYEVTPVIAARTPYLDSIFRLGAARPLTTWQKGFKSSWQNLMKRNLSGKQYKTIVDAWTCTCGRQKFDPHHLCKHLVQAVPPPSVNF
jgi:hypothetical protein